MVDYKKLLGKRIQLIRKSKGLTQENLAELVGIETPSLSYLETGKYAPSIETLQKLCEALKIEPWQLYYFSSVSDDEKISELKQALENNQKLVEIFYSLYKSIEY